MATMEDAKKLAWEVWEVYKGWGRWIYHKYRPWRPFLTWANLSMALVTVIAMVVGFVILFRKHQKRKRLEEERERRLSFSADDLFIQKQFLKKVKRKEKKEMFGDDGTGEVRSPANCPFKHLFGGLLDQPPPGHGPGGAGHGGVGEAGYEDKDDVMGKLLGEIRKSANRRPFEDGSGDGPRITEINDDLSSAESEEEESYSEKPLLTKDGRDPFDLAMHIPSELKKIQNKITTRELEKRLTEDQREEEARTRQQQLEQIFKLMQDQKDKFGEQNTTDIEEQMRMYSL